MKLHFLPTLRAKFALNHSNAQEALDILRVAAPYELGLPALGFYNWPNLYPVYVRGEAYLAAHALWVVQQLREAWAYKQPHRFLLFDRDSKFGADVVPAVRDIGSQPIRTAFRSPWQNGVAERWVGSWRLAPKGFGCIGNGRAEFVMADRLCRAKSKT